MLFKRILKPGGYVCLLWNQRETTTGLMNDYNDIIKRLYNDYPTGSARGHNTNDVFKNFYNNNFEIKNCFWHETLSFEELWGRSLSSSHAPVPGHPNYEPLKTALQGLFEKYNDNGAIQFEYRTEVIIGRL